MYDVKLCVTAGYGYADNDIDHYISTNRSDNIIAIHGVDADSQQLKMLLSRRCDVMAASNFGFYHNVKRNGFNLNNFKIVHKMGVFKNLIVFNPDLPNAEKLVSTVTEYYQELRQTDN